MTSSALHTKETKLLALPLSRLMARLQQHGFVIRPEDYIEILKVTEKFGGETSITAAHICPLIATTPEEQERFYKIFEEYQSEAIEEKPPPPSPRIKTWLLRYGWWLIAGIAMLGFFAVYRFLFVRPELVLNGELTPVKLSAGDEAYRVGDTVQFTAKAVLPPQQSDDSTIEFFWNTGNGFAQGTATENLVLEKEGTQTIQLKIRSAKFTVRDSLRTESLVVCGAAPQVSFAMNQESYKLGDKLHINAVYSPVNTVAFYKTLWMVNGQEHPAEQDGSLFLALDSTGSYQVDFLGLVTPEQTSESACAYRKRFDEVVIADNRYSVQASSFGNELAMPPVNRLHPALNWILLLPALLIALGTFLWWKKRKKKGGKEIPEAPLIKGKRPPYEIPFENNELKLVEPEAGFGEIYRSFRQKAEDELTIFNVRQSIQRTIHSGGIPDLIFTNKLRYTDYLILIDQTLTKSMQVKLFDYLVRALNEEAVNVERFYYSGKFEKIRNETAPNGYSFQRLAELYKAHTLIIIGNAHQLIYEAYPLLDKQLEQLLSDWEYKAILTPVAYKDWSEKENLIAQKFILLPADIQGQLLLIQAIREKKPSQQKYLSSIGGFYETALYDFESIHDVKTYVADDILFQWLCAAAVYHKLRWEVFIEIGKAICANSGQGEKMNYSNLLKFVRISWMIQGAFPAEVRLELLKQLTPLNEALARQTLLRMLRFSDIYFGEEAFYQEEKEVHKITSRFLLYAHDPARYAEFAEDQKLFQSLWENGKLWDIPQRVYLENPKGAWSTLLQADGKSTGVPHYFDSQKQEGLKSTRKVIRRNSVIAASLVVLLGMLHLFKNNLPPNTLLVKSSYTSASLTVVVTDSIQCEGDGSLDSLSGRLQLSNGQQFSLNFDAARRAVIDIPGDKLTDTTALLEISWGSEVSFNATSLVSVGRDTLHISLSACTVQPAYVVNIVYNDSSRTTEVENVASFLTQQGYNVRNTTYENIDSATNVYYFTENERYAADSLSQLLHLQFGNLFPEARTIKDTTLDFGQKKTMGIFLDFQDKKGTWMQAALDSRLNEIWQGSAGNRLIVIDSPLLYYSTGDKKTYGTYRIDEVWLNNSGVYKIITQAKPEYQVFFVRNLNRSAFDLSVCQSRYSTKEDARGVDESYCDRFNTMRLYYERNDNKIFLPLKASNALESTNAQKLKTIIAKLTELNTQQAGKTTLTGRLYYNRLFKWKVPENMPNPIVQTIPIQNESPFDRSYVQYNFTYAPEKNQVQSPERLLTTIRLDEKGNPQYAAGDPLKQIISYVNNYPSARVRMVYYYSNGADQKMKQQMISRMQRYLGSLNYKTRQVQFVTSASNNSYQPYQNNLPATSLNDVDVYGTNFPDDFLRSGTKKN